MRLVGLRCHRAKNLCDILKVEVWAIRRNFAVSDPETLRATSSPRRNHTSGCSVFQACATAPHLKNEAITTAQVQRPALLLVVECHARQSFSFRAAPIRDKLPRSLLLEGVASGDA